MKDKYIYHNEGLRAKIRKGKLWDNTINIVIEYKSQFLFFNVWSIWDKSVNIQFIGHSPEDCDDSFPRVNTSGNGYGDIIERHYTDRFDLNGMISKMFLEYEQAVKIHKENSFYIKQKIDSL